MQVLMLGQYLPRPLKRLLIPVWVIVEKIKIECQSRNTEINPAPIFVLGNQKSGTSAIAVLLAEMTSLSVSKDLVKEFLSKKQTYPRLRKGEVSFSKFLEMNRLDFSRDIVKEPNLTLLFQELSAHFPDSRFVFVVRDPRDNIRSLLNKLDIPGNLPRLNREHRKKITRGWDIVIDGRWLGIKGENYIEMLSERWNLMVDVYVENRDKIILTHYEDFLKDKVGEISRLASELSLTQVNDISDKVDIQYQPRGDREINWQDFFGADNLARIETLCNQRMSLLDYRLTVPPKKSDQVQDG